MGIISLEQKISLVANQKFHRLNQPIGSVNKGGDVQLRRIGFAFI